MKFSALSIQGQALVDKLYAIAIPIFKKKKIRKCVLEVINNNSKAIRVYERIGFRKVRDLKCYNGEINTSIIDDSKIDKIAFGKIPKNLSNRNCHYSWDNMSQAIIRSEIYETFVVKKTNNKTLGYFTINPQNGYLVQVESLNGKYKTVLSAASIISNKLKINNVESTRIPLVEALDEFNFENPIDQFEMEMFLD